MDVTIDINTATTPDGRIVALASISWRGRVVGRVEAENASLAQLRARREAEKIAADIEASRAALAELDTARRSVLDSNRADGPHARGIR